MSQANIETSYPNDSASPEKIQSKTSLLAAVALGTALILSLVGAYNLSRDITTMTQAQVPDLEQRLHSLAPEFIGAARANRQKGQQM